MLIKCISFFLFLDNFLVDMYIFRKCLTYFHFLINRLKHIHMFTYVFVVFQNYLQLFYIKTPVTILRNYAKQKVNKVVLIFLENVFLFISAKNHINTKRIINCFTAKHLEIGQLSKSLYRV